MLSSQHRTQLAATVVAGLLASFAVAAETQGCIASTNGSTTEVNAASTDSNLGSGCCAVLADSPIGNRVVMPSDDTYAARTEVPWALSARRDPRCIVLPRSGEEVGAAITALVDANRNQTCLFAVRSGGHTIWAESANIEYGVLLDLGYMNSTTYHAENRTASVLPGARWGAVYETLLAEDVAVAGGRDPDVGVGGFLLGGGNSFYASARGFACDNVANFQIVIANGSLIDANANMNSDLFQVLKGGTSNVGIVVRYDIKTFPASDLWGGIMAYPFSTSDQQLTALVNYTNNVHTAPNSSAITFYQDTESTNDTAILNVYTGTTPEVRPAIFDEFLAIPGNLTDSTRVANLTNMVTELGQPPGFRDTWWTLTSRADAATMQMIVEHHRDLAEQVRGESPTGKWIVNTLFQPVPSLFAEHGLEAGGNVMGLDRYDDNSMLWLLYLAWEGAEQDDYFNTIGAKAVKDVKAASVAAGTDRDFIYLNYADKTQAPLEGYGSEAVAKIQAASAKYDPTGVFQKLMPGGFKISLVNGSCSSELSGDATSGGSGSGSSSGTSGAMTLHGSVLGMCLAVLTALVYLL